MAMSDEHKAAIARGREESRAIKAYLETVADRKPGRPVTVQSVTEKLNRIEAKLAGEGDPLKRLELVQSRLDAEDQLRSLEVSVDVDALESDFVKHAASYSDRKGISYSAWREAGVSAPVLKKAGIARTRRG